MNRMSRYAIILAAGKGTRMKTDLPKCAYPLHGKPMVEYIVDNCKKCGIEKIAVVVGYKREYIKNILNDSVEYVIQEEQLGTAHAVMCARSLLEGSEGICLIFPGDMPLVNDKIVNGLIEYHLQNQNDLTVVTTILEDADGYGRIYRENGKVKRIVENSEASPEILNIKEVNSGLYCVDVGLLFWALDLVKNENAKKEYFLTDIIEILAKDHKVDGYVVKEGQYLMGINDLEALKKAEDLFK